MKDFKGVLGILVILIFSFSAFGNVFIVSESPIKGKVNLSPEDLNFINTLVSYSLNDLSDVLPYSYIDVLSVQNWYNSIIDIVNSTNTNVVIVKGKPAVPKPLPKIDIKVLNAQVISTITKVIPEINGVIVASYTAAGNNVKLDLQLLDRGGKPVSKKSLNISLSSLTDKDSIILQVKDTIVDLLGAWRYYYYDPKRTANVNIVVKPTANVSILVKPDNLQLKPGKTTLPEGEYTLIISAQGFKSLLTNVVIPAGGNVNLNFTLEKDTPIVSPVPIGMVYIDANVKGVPLIVAEGNIFGTTPLYTNLTEGVKNIIFQQTPTTLVKSVQIEVKPNQLNYYYITLDRVGAGVNIIADNGAFVVINRRLEGMITAGSYSKSLTRGIHTITVFKHGFEVFRTNVNITSDEKVTINVKLTPKKVPVFVVTPQTKEAIVSYQGKNISTTPYTIRVDQGVESKIDIIAQEVGFNNASITITPSMSRINSFVQTLSPLYGDLLVITDPTDAIVKIDGRVVGKTGLDGLLLRSISARKSFIFIQREGYKAVKTNMYILPNIQNSLSLKLKEAPIKLFVNTLPVQNVSIYFNDEYYGENDGVINVELGNFVMKLSKKGFKTIYTNVSFPDKVDTIIPLTFQMVPGLSDVEVVELVNSNLVEFDRLVSNENYFEANNVISKAKSDILNSGYTNYSVELQKLLDFVVKKENEIKPKVEFVLLSREADDVIQKADTFVRVNAYGDAVKLLKDFSKKLQESTLDDESKQQIFSRVRDKYISVSIMDVSNRVSNITIQIDKLVSRGEKSAAASLYEDAIKIIDESIVEFPEIETNLIGIRNSLISNYIPLGVEVLSNKVYRVLIDVEELERKKNLTNAIDLVSSTIKEVKLSKLYFLDEVKNMENLLNEKYEDLVNKLTEEEQMGEVKAIYDEIKPILKEAVRLASIEEYDSAIKKYQEALKIIELSELKENPFLNKVKNDIIGEIEKLEQEKRNREEMRAKKLKLQEEIEKKKKDLPWWTRMQKAWVGVSFEISGSILSPNMDFMITNMNIPVVTKLHISFLPIMGLSVGGYYNVSRNIVSTNSAYLIWMGLGQITLRIPIVKQFSIFGSFGTGVGQSINEPLKFRLGQDYLLNAGFDFKFNWFGLRLSYDISFYNDFNNKQMGGSFGIVLWATED